MVISRSTYVSCFFAFLVNFKLPTASGSVVFALTSHLPTAADNVTLLNQFVAMPPLLRLMKQLPAHSELQQYACALLARLAFLENLENVTLV